MYTGVCIGSDRLYAIDGRPVFDLWVLCTFVIGVRSMCVAANPDIESVACVVSCVVSGKIDTVASRRNIRAPQITIPKRDGCFFWSNLHCPHDLFKVSTPMCFAYLLLVLEVHTDLWATHLRWKAQSRPEPLHTMGYSPEVESPKPPRALTYHGLLTCGGKPVPG